MTIPLDHFSQRCIQRGILSVDGKTLRAALSWAIENTRDDLVEFVFRIEDADYWRFRVPEGIFYAVVKSGSVVTVFTQAMIRQRRGARRLSKKIKGRRDVRPR